jgi:hypothetical protein
MCSTDSGPMVHLCTYVLQGGGVQGPLMCSRGGGPGATYVQQSWWTQGPIMFSSGWRAQYHLCTAKVLDPGATYVQQCWWAQGPFKAFICSRGGGLSATYVQQR